MIKVPTLILDESRCRANIRAMARKCDTIGVELRPHFKTHQSLEIGRWFREEGIDRITVSSVGMARYFSEEWTDITIAFPVNVREIDEINSMAGKISLNLLVESRETANFLNAKLSHDVNVVIKINLGNNRAGLKPDDLDSISELADLIHSSEKMNFTGFLGHAGQTYKCRSEAEIMEVHSYAKSKLVKLKNYFSSSYPGIIASYGDTPSSSVCEDFQGIDEIRPGNFVFYDLMQLHIGSCSDKQIAVALACPVVAIHPEDSEIIIYGGGIHLSKDRLSNGQGEIFGQVVEYTSDGFGPILPGCFLRSLSQEHGVLKASRKLIESSKIGDIIHIFPVHSCMTANLMKSYVDFEGRHIPMFNPS